MSRESGGFFKFCSMNQPILRPNKQDRPRTSQRLPQMNKSNRLMRRYYNGRAPQPQPISIYETLGRP